ncbi:MAG TPA: globin family protein [Chitinophagaceae bacterium]|nr:globin family protein [Chitinophagaceae bacterium]
MTQHQINLIRASWAKASSMNTVVVGDLFYGKIFEIAPAARDMFKGSMAEQSRKVFSMLNYVISKLDRLDDIIGEVEKLARRHTNYGVREEHYSVVGDALLWTLEQGLGDQWNDELKQAWAECYSILATAMINAAAYTADAA